MMIGQMRSLCRQKQRYALKHCQTYSMTQPKLYRWLMLKNCYKYFQNSINIWTFILHVLYFHCWSRIFFFFWLDSLGFTVVGYNTLSLTATLWKAFPSNISLCFTHSNQTEVCMPSTDSQQSLSIPAIWRYCSVYY